MITSMLRKVTSTRYIFLLSGLVFLLWWITLLAFILPTLRTERTTRSSDLSYPGGLGVARTSIYVISLAGRQDRRDQMEQLKTAQGLTWTIMDAIPSNATLVQHVLDRVSLLRAERTSNATSVFRWPEEIDARSVSQEPLVPSGSDTWGAPAPRSKSISGTSRSGASSKVLCAVDDDAIPTLANNTVAPEWLVLSPAKIACWHSHVLAIQRFVQGPDLDAHHDQRRADDVALILEDDIDMEKDVSTRLAQVWPFLPPGWDIVFLGHCWSNESYYPALTAFAETNLHPSYHPKCTHAYALSRTGARRLLQHLRYPPFAYSRAVDQAYAWLVCSGRLRSYSIVPSLVIQRKRGRSDILPGSGSEWREELLDGVLGA